MISEGGIVRKVAETARHLTVVSQTVEWRPTIKDLPQDERPRERLVRHGASELSTPELLAIVLRTGVPSRTVTKVAEDLLLDFKGLTGLARASISEICEHRGVGEAKATQLKAALEIGRRLLLEQPEERRQVRSPFDVFDMLRLEMAPLEHEQFKIVLLDTKNRVMTVKKLYEGSVNTSIVRVGEVFREAVRQNAAAIVVVHNHPSGDPAPSAEDVRVTQEMAQAGKLLDVEVLDHVIIGGASFVSLKERGLGFASVAR
ncbi:MAG: DNA repair protein RadC [Chloroflexi bacterium]|nr:DNA repair protein RadC [Chloroflexota bacterium]